MNESQHPKLRWPLDIKIEKLGDREALVIRCPLGIVDAPLLLVPSVAPLLSSFTGLESFDSIISKFSGQGLQPDLLEEVIRILDQHFFLANARFSAEEDRVKTQFRQSATRPAFLAGLSYLSDPAKLGAYIDGLVADESPILKTTSETLCVVAPHIDYRRGEKGYAGIYRLIKDSNPDLVILLGTSHQWSKGLFHLSKKDFLSPVGSSVCDREFVDKLAAAYGTARSFDEELLHRREHSLELQLPFLQKIIANAKVVPILVGSFFHMVQEEKPPTYFSEYSDFAGALSELFSVELRSGRKCLFVAGVDMAHVGSYFGDGSKLSPEFMEHIRVRDTEYLKTIANHDTQALFTHIEEDQDARKICGFPTMYTVLDVLGRAQKNTIATFTDYHQAVDYASDCAVTFAGMRLDHSS